MSGRARTYAGATAGERATRRRAALLDAALDVIAESGVAGVTVRGVCAAARLNDRYFYESFANTDDLMVATFEAQMTASAAEMVAAIAASPPDPLLRARAAIGTGLGYLTADPRRGRLLVESQATEALRARRRDVITMLAQIMAEQGRTLLPIENPLDADMDLAAHTLVAGGLDLVTGWLRGEVDVSREHLEDFLVAMVTARRRA
ncbi:MAG: TetR/AcrR family transcriptional regulator [Mycolicibacterium insubricum]|jgi:AcrR family transcriptional regulator|uniref:TetR family transcriptional regulator n=1 Tax=Mycolicibacterium insubricum TaxID=444597 RepID=A0A1X0DJ43_9MYCO|nr:TetR/AcrR family transcriptional regulator [Mycolicibacterium insubricum]MCB0928955.1 TetR/AcrR family transcriptional regulator [Mycobacterium sp.]MCB9440012.1 TetR/AcrR family transcriptional regulator [Mycolicibacterium sp.]MCV7080511.1 TetR/AcrR family transcriptional regulator [Mycolicibacterium insubricum]ORA72212.1 TetR family transcriptional regulator [Mycolicibacterium insubricum]BBZ66559.1 putative transcriptional regulator, TetR family protein [Mycolicibacterium insubricum]